jgi:hypothetical protein
MAETNNATTVKPAERVPVVGDDVLLRVGPSRAFPEGRFFPARVTRIGRGGKIDLLTCGEETDEAIAITSSPHDETGKHPDSWKYAH